MKPSARLRRLGSVMALLALAPVPAAVRAGSGSSVTIPGVIVLFTDFGLSDPYVGQMHAVLARERLLGLV